MGRQVYLGEKGVNLPIENPRKYGEFDDITDEDANDIDRVLTGGQSLGRVRSRSVSESQNADQVDEDFFSAARDQSKKYGG